jgi:hypothetical protein
LGKIIEDFKTAGYNKFIMIVGEDRIEPFQKALRNENAEVILAGDRNDELDIADVISKECNPLTANDILPLKDLSATLMREFVTKHMARSFAKYVKMGNMTDEDVVDLMNLIRFGLRLGPYDPELDECLKYKSSLGGKMKRKNKKNSKPKTKVKKQKSKPKKIIKRIQNKRH